MCVFVLFEMVGLLAAARLMGLLIDEVFVIMLMFVLVYDMFVYMMIGSYQDSDSVYIIYPIVNVLLSIPTLLILFLPYSIVGVCNIMYDFYVTFWPLVVMRLLFASVYAVALFRERRMGNPAR